MRSMSNRPTLLRQDNTSIASPPSFDLSVEISVRLWRGKRQGERRERRR